MPHVYTTHRCASADGAEHAQVRARVQADSGYFSYVTKGMPNVLLPSCRFGRACAGCFRSWIFCAGCTLSHPFCIRPMPHSVAVPCFYATLFVNGY